MNITTSCNRCRPGRPCALHDRRVAHHAAVRHLRDLRPPHAPGKSAARRPISGASAWPRFFWRFGRTPSATGLPARRSRCFLLSGFFGIGLGDTGYFQALPRLGSRRTVLLVQCLTAPFAALIEWLWLGTKLNLSEMFCIAIILTGVAVALAPGDHAENCAAPIVDRDCVLPFSPPSCGAFGAVMSRKAFAVAHAAGELSRRRHDRLSARAGRHSVSGHHFARGRNGVPPTRTAACLRKKPCHVSREKWRRIWPWVLGNSLAGQTLGVTCMQWALEKTPRRHRHRRRRAHARDFCCR